MKIFTIGLIAMVVSLECNLWAADEAISSKRVMDSMVVETDVPIGKGGERELKIDLAYPMDLPDKPMPVIVWIHGGAWLGGSKSLDEVMPLVEKGFFAAGIQYRLSPEAIWPAQIEDCKTAIRFLRANAKTYHIDPERIGVWGASAGGHLAAMLGTSGDVKELEGKGGWLDQSSRVQAVVDYFGPTDLTQMGKFPGSMDHDSPDSPESRLVGGPIQEKKDIANTANPITYITQDDPPFLIVHGDQDDLVPFNQSELLHDALTKAGIPSELVQVKNGGHGGWERQKTEPENEEILNRVYEFLTQHLMK